MSKFTHPLLQLLVMVAFALGMMLFSSLLTALFVVAGVDVMGMPGSLWLQAVVQLLVFAVPAVAVAMMYHAGTWRQHIGLDFSGRQWRWAMIGVVILLLIYPVNEWLTAWNDGWNLGPIGDRLRQLQQSTEGLIEQFLSVDSVGGLLANLLVVALIPAVSEELFFRAGVQNQLMAWLRNKHVAVLLTAVIFSLGHGEVFAFVPRFVLGALLGYMYVYSGSVVVNMTAHFVNNAIVVVVYWLAARGVIDMDLDAPMDFGWLLIVCCTIAAVALFCVSFLNRRKADSGDGQSAQL